MPACGRPIQARAHGRARSPQRCIRAFSALRNEMTMCMRERVDVRPWSDALAADIARVDEIWNESRRALRRRGRFLCGAFSLADAFYAPVAFRFRTYGVQPDGDAGTTCQALLAHPFLREWEAAALAESDGHRVGRAARHLPRQARCRGRAFDRHVGRRRSRLCRRAIRAARRARRRCVSAAAAPRISTAGARRRRPRHAASTRASSTTSPQNSSSPRAPARSLTEIESAMRARGQMLAFEPPHYRRRGRTLGGAVARVCRVRAAPMRAPCATSCSACASSTARATICRSAGA